MSKIKTEQSIKFMLHKIIYNNLLLFSLQATEGNYSNSKPLETIRNQLETTENHPKPSATTQNFLQPTTNYPELAIISLKPPETPNSQPLNAFG